MKNFFPSYDLYILMGKLGRTPLLLTKWAESFIIRLIFLTFSHLRREYEAI